MNLHVETENFTSKLYKYQRLTGKSFQDIVREQAKLLAKRLADLSPPKSKAQGSKSVAIDIGKVYLANDWFENTFQFQNQTLGERVKNLVIEKNATDLQAIFQHSGRLNKLHIEPFDAKKHKDARKAGRVNYPEPYSFPLDQQGRVKKYTKDKQKNVGMAKAGWAWCYKLLDGTIPSWLSKEVGTVSPTPNGADLDQNKPTITLTNTVAYFSTINKRMDIVGRALAGRSRDMIKSAELAIEKAKSESGF